jgi:hypothetical protein
MHVDPAQHSLAKHHASQRPANYPGERANTSLSDKQKQRTFVGELMLPLRSSFHVMGNMSALRKVMLGAREKHTVRVTVAVRWTHALTIRVGMR